MKIQLSKYIVISLLFTLKVATQLNAQYSKVPGTVIKHISASTKTYIGSPSICILPNGDYVVTHDLFGPGSTADKEGLTLVFKSRDKGKSWEKVTEINGQMWSTLFVGGNNLYLIGTAKQDGDLVIRRSDDGGKTWTDADSPSSGVLREGHFHTAPVPVLLHNGRICRDVEQVVHGTTGSPYRPLVVSALEDADLLDASNWVFSDPLLSDTAFLSGKFRSWLEGNTVIGVDGKMLNILRVSTNEKGNDKAAIAEIDDDGKTISFDPTNGFIDFGGGARKFCIRYDEKTKKYWTISNLVMPEYASLNAGSVRNTLVIKSSDDLLDWTVHKILLYHPDAEKHGFQYADWQIESKDIIYVSRTAFNDKEGGADNYHNANYLTFHRVKNYKKLLRKKIVLTDMK